ncbi:MAG TPA: HAD family phosphatase [Candidatus Binataceae bacterium]|nr:HAD family phosphatase [Candidatus Binataceae bacterium]
MSVQRSIRAKNGRAAAKRVAFYDLDGTLASLNLMHLTLYFFANLGEWTGRAGYLLNFAGRVPALYFAEKRDRHLLNVVLFELFKGVSRDRLEELGDEYCANILMKNLYPEARAMIEANRAEGIAPVLVTGSPDFVAAPLARRLDIPHIAANRLAYNRGLATGRLRAPVMAGDEKAAWSVQYAAANQLDLANCWGYADSYYDLPFLAAMGHPVAVNPDHRLAATAHSRQWPVVRFGHKSERATLVQELRARTENWIWRRLDGAA